MLNQPIDMMQGFAQRQIGIRNTPYPDLVRLGWRRTGLALVLPFCGNGLVDALFQFLNLGFELFERTVGASALSIDKRIVLLFSW